MDSSGVVTLQRRKQEFVRGELWNAALELFAEKGFEATTVEEIAEAVGVSRRTFFRYFSSKEDVLMAAISQYGDDLVEEIGKRPAGETVGVAIRRAVIPLMKGYVANAQQVRTVTRILHESTALRGAKLERFSRVESQLTELLAKRLKVDPKKNYQPRLLASTTLSVLNIAFETWFSKGRGDIAAIIEEIFGLVAEGSGLRV